MEVHQVWPKVSIIIVSYNHRHYLGDCLSSVLAQNYPDYEVLVVDNASVDGSADYVVQTFPGVRLIRNEQNLGFSFANNLGVKHATSDYLAFLNPDIKVDPDWLRELVIVLQTDPGIGLVTPKILLLADPNKINTCGNEIHFTGLTLCRGVGQPPHTFNTVEEVDAVSGAAFVIRKSLFDQLGGFDEDFFMYVEDTDLSWRARLADFKCLYAPKAIVYHDYQLRFGPRKTFYQERNRYVMLLKSLNWWTLFVLAPALFLSEIVTWGFILLQDRRNFWNKLQAYGWLVRNWAKVMEARAHTQSLRQVKDSELLDRCDYRLDFELTAGNKLAGLTHLIFDPLFFLLWKLSLFLLWC